MLFSNVKLKVTKTNKSYETLNFKNDVDVCSCTLKNKAFIYVTTYKNVNVIGDMFIFFCFDQNIENSLFVGSKISCCVP